MQNGIILVETTGAEVGQVNGLSVIDLGDMSFGQPNKITATVGVGREGIVDLQREARMIEGDSATVAETCALLSRLAEVPVKQSYAITGSMNQRGEVQAIGGANYKIEGFFDVCLQRGLTGQQGVIIPASNVQHLMRHSPSKPVC